LVQFKHKKERKKMTMKHFFNHCGKINTSFGEYAVKRNDGSCYPEMGSQRIYKFPNGYGASVVRHENSYGGRKGLFELAVLDANGDICYSSPITNDVIGWLTIEQVDDLLDDISQLPGAIFATATPL
jgi:hypothetical protein